MGGVGEVVGFEGMVVVDLKVVFVGDDAVVVDDVFDGEIVMDLGVDIRGGRIIEGVVGLCLDELRDLLVKV